MYSKSHYLKPIIVICDLKVSYDFQSNLNEVPCNYRSESE